MNKKLNTKLLSVSFNNIYIYKVKLATVVEGYPKAPFTIATPFPGLLHFTLETYLIMRRCPWCNGYRRRKWTRQHEFKTWTRLIAFHIALIPLGKV